LRTQTNLLPAAVPDLVIRAFGKPQVRVKGRLVTQQQWQTRSVREMFFMFVHTPGGLTKEQIGELLWPGSEPESLKLRFKNDLYRLRRAVGQNVILFDGSSYFFNRNLDYEYDMDTFEQSLRQMRAARDAEEKLRLCQDAIAVVRGRFLEDIDSTWVEADRERYRQEYMRILLSMAGLLLDRRETAEALKVCQYALAADRTLEEAHRMMMRIHAARGDRMGITRQYQACHAAMEEELGLVPSLETEVLFRELTS
jgi:two-component SAPR family response regulator